MLMAALLSSVALAEAPEVFPLGKVIPKVECAANNRQSYALYLPTTYRKEIRHPLLFIFEPAARGPLPVRIMHEAAEKYGYILIASNNSRNGPFAPELEAAEAMWKDALSRFSIDPKRMYLAGFSGGARAAITFATACKGCIAGVAASGAGFPPGIEPKSANYFALFSAIGNDDFNFPEILELEPRLRSAELTFHVRRFDGVHQWAPSDVWLEAFQWFDLQAMKSGALQKNAAAINESLRTAQDRARQLESANKPFEALRLYRQIAADYTNLADVSEAKQRADTLTKLKEVRDAEKREHQDADLQAKLTAQIWQKLETLIENPAEEQANLRDLHSSLSDLRRRVDNEEDPQRSVVKRALNQEIVHAFETGGHFLDRKDYRNALIYYDVIVSVAKQAPGAHLQKARAHAGLNDKKQALEELHLAVRDGLTDPASLDQPEFASLRDNPEFKSILDSVPPSKQ
jgi:dienelactone hydrolase